MHKTMKQKGRHSLITIVVALLLVCTLTVTAFADADLSNTIGVDDLNVASSGGTDWAGIAGGATWSGTSSEKKGCDGKVEGYNAASGQLVLKNTSGSSAMLTFGYTSELNGGSLTIDNTAVTNGSFNKLLDNNASVTISVTSSGSAANTTKATIFNIKLEAAKEITLTFAPASNGSYTMNGTAVTANTVVTGINTVGYSLVATPASGYFFDGWYWGDAKVSGTATASNLTFAESGTVTARFLPNYMNDPLYKQAKVPADSTKTKDELVSINSFYLHDSTEKLVADGSFPANNSAYSKTAASKTKDKIDVQYIPSLVWNDSMKVANSGTAFGDYKTGYAQETFAYVRMMTDIIRIYAKENCNISFDYTNSLAISGGDEERDKQTTIYTYITTSSSATVANVKTGTKLTATVGSSGSIALSKGNYLYIMAEGFVKPYTSGIFTDKQLKATFDYSASISNVTVEYNEKKDILSAGFRDNTGKVLGSGQIIVNNVGQNINSNGNMADMSFVDLAAVELKVGSVPANYVHIGWEITPKGGSTTYQYTPTYSRTLKEDVTVNALFVPKTTITMGANGYADATYKDFNGNALNGQYVARNADCTAHYTSLADAFSKTDTVVLLAGSTIEGDWTIPAGKTFVIPYGMNDKGSTTPDPNGMAWGMGGDYCLVNLNGNLKVEGTLLVNAQQNQSTGATGGNPGHLVVPSGKTITVSGSLYAYGPVTGAGKVETTTTAKIHETMEFCDNDVVIYIYNIYNEKGSKKVFPFNTMFINSIEIPVTYQQGATLTGHVAVRYHEVSTADIPVIAPSGAMMNHTAGTITKYFDHSKGQFVFRYNEGSKVSTGTFSISMDVVIGVMEQTVDMNSADYYIPLSAPFRYEIAGELTLNGKYKLLPGMTVDVKESGTLTIAEGSEVVAYRRNDFDYRGKHGNSTEQWGYTAAAYPQNPQRFNGVSYPFGFNNSNMGSAKLNVDGQLIVNGGFYVTNEVQTDTENGLTLTADGYNYLTGSGIIDMTNAKESLTAINEVMRAGSTNDLKWDTVAVVPLKGLPAEATANDPSQYVSLSGKVYGTENANGLNVWTGDPCGDGHTDEANEEGFIDHICDICKEENISECVDAPAEGETYSDHKCDLCGKEGISECTDGEDTDTLCDICGKNLCTHQDIKTVDAVAPDCVNAGVKAYFHCDICGFNYADVEYKIEIADLEAWKQGDGKIAPLNHDTIDVNKDHICDREGCTVVISSCADDKTATAEKAATCIAEGNIAYWTCNICGKYYSDETCVTEIAENSWLTPIDGTAHADANTDHTCDYGCDKYFGTCEDADKDHACDYGCDKVYGEHKDTNNDHICEYGCSKMIEVCEDGNKDHACDYGCGKTYGTCEDKDRNHTCDYGCSKVHGTCGDADKDHDCDYGCGLKYGTCADTNKDHYCDYGAGVEGGCPVYFNKHEDTTGDGDHACDYCNAKITECTEGEPKKENIKAPTCTADGSHDDVWYCTECNTELRWKNDVVDPALGHDMIDDAYKAPTCEDTGLEKGSHCSRCDYKIEQAIIPAKGHDIVIDKAVAATCTATGLTEGSHCSRCNDKTIAQEVIAALGHNMVTDNAVAPSCEETGLTEGSHCTRCDDATTEQNEIPALGHSYKAVVTEATCTTAGFTTKICATCGDSNVSDQVAALGHKKVALEAKDPTCTETGLTAGAQCATCGEVLKAQNVVDALGHKEETVPGKDATCEAAGLTDGVKCSVCQETLTAQDTIPALGHTEEILAAEEATCSKPGKTEGKKCSVCNEILVAQTVTETKPHTVVIDEAIAATCTTPGKTEGKHCSACNEVLVAQTVTDLAPHTEVTDDAKAPTCTEAGLTEGTHCDVCNTPIIIQEIVPAKGHTDEVVPGYAADCEKDGLTDGAKCSVCGVTTLERTSIPASGHKWTDGICENNSSHTCPGHVYDSETGICKICGLNCIHKYNDIVNDPTCTEQGYTTHTCEICGIVTIDSYVEANGHKWADATCTTPKTCSTCGTIEGKANGHKSSKVEVISATCTVDGYLLVTCNGCGTTFDSREEGFAKDYLAEMSWIYKLEATGHVNGTPVVENEVAANCTTDGSYDKTTYCDVCDVEIGRDTVVVPATGHTAGEAIKENEVKVTCSTDGSYDTVVYCTACKAELSREGTIVKAEGHNYGDWVVVDATCTENGSETRSCGSCGEKETNVIPASGHNYKTTVTDPTCSSGGFTTYTCACGHSYTSNEVSSLGHTDVIDKAVEPSCTETGLTEGSHCSVCGEITKAQEEVSALGHNVPEKSHICDRCEETITFCGTIYRDFGDGQVKISNAGLLALKKSTFGRKMGAQLLLDKVDFTSDVAKNLSESVFEKLFASNDFRHYMAELLDCEPSQLEEVAVELAEHDTLLVEEIRANAVILYAAKLVTEMDEEEYQNVLNDTDLKETILEKLDHAESAAEGLADAALAYAVYVAFAVDSNDSDRIEKMGQAGSWIQDLDDAYRDFANSEQGLVDRIGFVETLKMVTVSAEDASAVRKVLKEGYNSTDLVTILEDALNNFSHQCEICGATVTNHDYAITVTKPDCTEKGFTTYTCYGCNESYQDNYVDALTHVAVVQPGKEATCTESGLTEGSVCQRCGDVLVEQEVISSTGHTSGEVKKENEVPATCTKPGSYNKVTYCSVCGEVSSCTTVTVPALNHKDENKDHICDNGCGEPQGEHTAASGSHNCGYCGEKVSDCADNDGDHNCDVCGEKLSGCADKTGDEDHKCDICGKDDITAHEWTPATYDVPKTCTECGKTLGDPLVRPVEIVKPEYVTAEPSEGITKEEVEKVMSSVVDSIVEAAQKTEQPETGINAEKNKTAVENAKTEIKDKDQNVVTGHSYETSLVITLNAVVLDKDEENVITKKVTFDVSPILYALDANGTKIGQTKITSFAEPITFRLPVAENAKAKFARVLHEGVDDLGLYRILTDAAGNRFVEVKAKNFSQFSLVLEEECTDHNFVDGQCTICGAEEPVTLVDFAGTTMTLGNSLAMNFVIDTALLNGTDHYAVITKTYADKSPISKTIQQADWNVYDGTLYYFAFDDIAAKEMGDKLTVIVYRNDGTQVSVVRKDSVYDYAMRMLVKEEAKASPNPEKLTLYVDMLNYGAAAQTEFEYSLHTLVNRDLTEAQQAYATNYMDISDSRIKGNGYAGSTLTLKSNIILNFVFNKTVVSKDMYAIATYKNHYGYDKNVRIEGDKFVEYDDARWYIPVSGMVVADCSSLVTITIYNADGTIVTSAADSVESYVARMSSAKPLYLAIIKFGLAAYASFH